jgi:hypothetical protein
MTVTAGIWPERSRSNCPVKKDAEEGVKLGSGTLRAMRRLRRNTKP